MTLVLSLGFTILPLGHQCFVVFRNRVVGFTMQSARAVAYPRRSENQFSAFPIEGERNISPPI
jgi:hypothetical protein